MSQVLDVGTTVSLLASAGRLDDLLAYAQVWAWSHCVWDNGCPGRASSAEMS